MNQRISVVPKIDRIFAILKRWRDLIVYGLCGAFIATWIAPYLSEKLVDRLVQRVSVNAVPWVLAVFGFTVLFALHKLAGTRLTHLKQVLAYPPLPVAVVIGIGVIPI